MTDVQRQIDALREELRREILKSARQYQARIDTLESSRELLVAQIRKLAQSAVVRPYANQLLCTLEEPCVAEEDVREKRLERLLEEITRLASQPGRGLI